MQTPAQRKMDRKIKKRKKKNPNKLTPLNHGGGIFFFYAEICGKSKNTI